MVLKLHMKMKLSIFIEIPKTENFPLKIINYQFINLQIISDVSKLVLLVSVFKNIFCYSFT